MKRGLRYAGWTFVAAAALAIICRAILVCSHVEGGWEILGDHFVASLPPAVTQRLCGPQMNPYRRENLWLLEQLDQIEANPASSATDRMGAALAAAHAVHADLPRMFPVMARSIGSAIWARQIDNRYDDWNEVDRLDDDILKGSQELARRATEIEPKQLNWWRLRALVTWISSNFGRRGSVSDFETFVDCGRHDPDNALYDYLSGFECYWVSSADRGDWQFDARFIRDWPLYKIAIDAYRRGLAKEFISTGNAGDCVQQFYARHPGNVAVKLLHTRSTELDATREFIHVEMAQPFWDAIDYHAGLQDLHTMLQLWQHGQLRLAQQYAAGHEAPARRNTRAASLNEFYCILNQFFDSAETSESERDRIGGLVDKIVHLTNEEVRDYQQRMSEIDYWSRAAVDARKVQEAGLYSALGVAAGAATILMLLVAIGALFLSRRSDGQQKSATSEKAFWPTILWFVLLAITIVALGFVVSYEPRWNNLHVAVQWGIAAVSAVGIGSSFWIAARAVWRKPSTPAKPRPLSFQLARLWLVIIGTFLLVGPLFFLVDRKFRFGIVDLWQNFPRNFVHNVGQQPRGTIEGIPEQTPADAIIQWGTHRGLFWTCGTWLVLLLLWSWMRSDSFLGHRARLAAALRPISRSALIVAGLLLLFSIAATTQWIASLQAQSDQTLSRMVEAQVAATN